MKSTQPPRLPTITGLTADLAAQKAALLDASQRPNTQQALAASVKHFQQTFGGLLPTTPGVIEHYVMTYHQTLAPSTLRQRLSLLGRWHRERGLPDPTQAPNVRDLMKGVRVTRAHQPKKARPMDFDTLKTLVAGLDLAYNDAESTADRRARRAVQLQCLRDKAFVLLGFWCAWRSDELIRLQVEHTEVTVEEAVSVLSLYLPYTKGDREAQGRSWRLPALPHHCPVAAVQDWLAAAQLTVGPVFAGVNRWGDVSDAPLHADSVITLLRRAMVRAGIDADTAKSYSSHSLRRGFANWAIDNEATVRELLDWVGWKNMSTAIDYLTQRKTLPEKLLQQLAAVPADSA